MLTPFIENFSQFIGISPRIIPDTITILVTFGLILTGLKGSLGNLGLVLSYFTIMLALQILGLESSFNLITLAGRIISEVVKIIF